MGAAPGEAGGGPAGAGEGMGEGGGGGAMAPGASDRAITGSGAIGAAPQPVASWSAASWSARVTRVRRTVAKLRREEQEKFSIGISRWIGTRFQGGERRPVG